MKKYPLILIVAWCVAACDDVAIDRCLDSGGRWNYENRVCDRGEDPELLEEANRCLERGGIWNYEEKVCELGSE